MKAVIQRVHNAKVEVGQVTVGQIQKGVLVFLGVNKNDTREDADYLVDKLIHLRIFEDSQGYLNLSSLEAGAQFLVVSQFTLYGDCRKGRRPSFDQAANPQDAEVLYNYFVERLKAKSVTVETGQFRAMMNVSLVNDGPVTFVIESEKG